MQTMRDKPTGIPVCQQADRASGRGRRCKFYRLDKRELVENAHKGYFTVYLHADIIRNVA